MGMFTQLYLKILSIQRNISSRFSSKASELLENLEEIFPWYYTCTVIGLSLKITYKICWKVLYEKPY